MRGQARQPQPVSLVILSEGAAWEGYTVRESGKRDAFGHAKKANVGEDLAREVERATREETLVSDLTYDLRGGEPDFIDKMVAITFGNMAMDCIASGQSGLMTGIVDGCYAMVPFPDPKLGPRKLDVATMYNTDRYRPNYTGKRGCRSCLRAPESGRHAKHIHFLSPASLQRVPEVPSLLGMA